MSRHTTEFTFSGIGDLFGHHSDSVTYTPLSGQASTISLVINDRDVIYEEMDEDGDVIKREMSGFITADSTRTDHPGIDTPVRGDKVTVGGVSYYLVAFTPTSTAGMWRVFLRNVDVLRGGMSNTRLR